MPDFDFIIVGAGTAGCVLASRLSADAGTRVLLLEAGSADPLPEQAIPPAWPTLLQGPASWAEFTTPQAATGTATLLPRGRGLGGSSAINAMVFTRGHRSSYDRWPEQGAKNWGFFDLLPYFKRTERTVGRDPSLRGTSGPLTVGPAIPGHPVISACLRAAEQAGHPAAADVSGGLDEGFGWTDLNIVSGRRQSAADAYLMPALSRPNLTLAAGTLARRLLIEDGHCTGVEYRTEASPGQVTTASAREVIVAAGTIGSAQLLMLSGIGPRRHLEEFGIDVAADLPGVGANFHDHPIANVVYSPSRPVPERRYNHGEAIGLVRSTPTLEAPDLQVVFVDAPTHLPSVQGPEDGYTIGVSLMTPHSRGTVRLADAVPGSSPMIDPGYFSDERDMAALIEGVRLAREIGQAQALDEWRGEEVLPGPQLTADGQLRDYIGRTLASYCHPVGTCKIGQDEWSVVDLELKVHGIDGLRVADASVIPSIPSGNTNATVYAIAERAADLLRGIAPDDRA